MESWSNGIATFNTPSLQVLGEHELGAASFQNVMWRSVCEGTPGHFAPRRLGRILNDGYATALLDTIEAHRTVVIPGGF